MSILITGAAGFIGSSLVDKLLSQGEQVIGIDNFCNFYSPNIKRQNIKSAKENANFTLVEADITSRQSIKTIFDTYKPSAVVHLAAMAGVRPSIENAEYFAKVNVQGTVNLLDSAVENNVERFVFASSSSVYGNNKKIPFAETDNVDYPISPYAATKKAGELICHTYHHLYNLPITCLRFFTVFGPRQRPDLAICKFMNLIQNGEPIPMFGDGTTSRDYTYIDDIIEGVCAAIEKTNKQTGYRIYNLGGNEPVTLSELIAAIEKVMGKTAIKKTLPTQPGDVNRTWADLARSQNELNYTPKTSLIEGLEKQYSSFPRRACPRPDRGRESS